MWSALRTWKKRRSGYCDSVLLSLLLRGLYHEAPATFFRRRCCLSPMPRGKLSKGDVFSVEQTREAQHNLARNASDEDEDGERQTDRVQAEEEEREEEEQRLSPKIQALLLDVEEALQADKTVKSVVFSSFLSCLDEIESAMIAAGIPVFRIDNTTSILQPRRLIQDFDSCPQGTLLLLSSKVTILPTSFPLLPSPRSDLQLGGRRGALAHHGVESSHDGTIALFSETCRDYV